ncbi:31282_t:CDS:2 [Gigaspora margarita]|uniref:31282_t:CDS:1 n=1 Tax=Gigaspora margarita TaxID=4874 RepID=A0ABM8W1D5_GIGMA|nr:31282_t:CDS:2 [Gigaspora margarita]
MVGEIAASLVTMTANILCPEFGEFMANVSRMGGFGAEIYGAEAGSSANRIVNMSGRKSHRESCIDYQEDNEILLILLAKKNQLEKERDEAVDKAMVKLSKIYQLLFCLFLVSSWTLLRIGFKNDEPMSQLEIKMLGFISVLFLVIVLVANFLFHREMRKNPRIFCIHGKFGDEISRVEKEILKELSRVDFLFETDQEKSEAKEKKNK